ncbi:MAG: hypothetical protein ACP5IL_00435 [Syntrophobacteraceae bacterium]
MEEDLARKRAFEQVKPMLSTLLDNLGKAIYGRSLRRPRYAILEYDTIYRLSLQWRPKDIVPFPVLNLTLQNFQNSFQSVEIFNARNQSRVVVPVDQAKLKAAIEKITPSLYLPTPENAKASFWKGLFDFLRAKSHDLIAN